MSVALSMACRRPGRLALFYLATLVACLIFATAAGAAEGATYEHRVLLDLDNDTGTGCDIAVEDAGGATTVHGVEQVVIIRVTRTGPESAAVTEIATQVCNGGSLSAESLVDPGDWPVGIAVGTDGSDVVEGRVSRNALGNPTGVARLAFSSTRTGFSDALLVTAPGGTTPILFSFPAAVALTPALSEWGIAIALVLLALVAFRSLRSAPGVAAVVLALSLVFIAGPGLAEKRTIVMDGQVGDWAGIAPLAIDQTGDSTIGDPAEDIVAAFATADDAFVYFRIDLVNVARFDATTTFGVDFGSCS